MTATGLIAIGISILTPDPAEPTRVVAEATDAPAGSKVSLHLVDPKTGEPGPAIFSKTEETGKGIRLTPSFGLSRGATYRAVVQPLKGEPVSAEYEIPTAESPGEPTVEEVYPTAEKVPANLLKFYLYFSEPMREGRDIFERLHIETDTGERVHDPWRRRELWSDNAKRLTVWIHPGRVKRGVNLREEFGPVLHPNRKYTLVIDGTIRSAAGVEIGRETRHRLSTLPEDYQRPLPESWILTAPEVATRAPLRIESPEPLDHVLIARHIDVRDPAGQPLAVKFEIEPGEKRWSIVPDNPWAKGEHRIEISEFLEDLAGNTRLRVFDTDLSQPPPEPGAETLTFTPES